MLLAYSTWGMPTVPIDTAVAHCAALGYDGLELRLLDGTIIDGALPSDQRRRICATAAQAGTSIIGLDTSLRVAQTDPAAQAEQVRSGWTPDDYPKSWPCAERLGILPPGTAPFTPRIEREVAKRKSKIRSDLASADYLHYPKAEVAEVLRFWKIDLS